MATLPPSAVGPLLDSIRLGSGRPVQAWAAKYPDVRYLDIHHGALDEAQFTDWVRQASKLPGETM
ncbi:MAG: hypothetical protein ACK4SZ_08195 [Allosphingosinicella sp.]|uniref:hypothetical protein n=1 Tax=Allosphingosinicella sp. TaxID=2823234 RepID=UPI00395EFFA8